MSKRNIAYIKPEDPNFLKRIKQQIGYKEGPTVDTKKEELHYDSSDYEKSDAEDEQPQVVVLKVGDLTKREAEAEKKRITTEENEKPADLTERIIFKTNHKSKETTSSASSSAKEEIKEKSSTKQKKSGKVALSFDIEEEEDE